MTLNIIYLLKPNLLAVLPEALPAHHQSIFTDDAMSVGAALAVDQRAGERSEIKNTLWPRINILKNQIRLLEFVLQ